MARVTYKTRGNANPKGKQKVYFTCHEKDYAKYFESISEEILKLQDCAIWYDAEPEALYDEIEFLEDLSQMQLFVIPITKNFLMTYNRALELEFRYAIEHKIPVLPLMMDNALVMDFNKKCGDIQYLEPYAKDETAISYEAKLETYLKTVLVGDEMAEKVRSAFDAYVFLSYRKKDRRYAQELMRLIHKNEFCRDIAIWYDEFLTPGENFNDAIEAALNKSSLFALVVTPNLVNEENYVMTVEYPMAKANGKPLLPVEMVETDKDALEKNYEGLPLCTNVQDEEALSKVLLQAVRNIAIREKADSPEHDFFIGLAYLGGIDVEIDYEKAVKLITYAAEQGVVEAVEKLAGMYQKGEGVKRDYDEAIRWKEKLVEKYFDEYSSATKAGEVERAKHLAEKVFCTMYEVVEEHYNFRGSDICEQGVTFSDNSFTNTEIFSTTIYSMWQDEYTAHMVYKCYEQRARILAKTQGIWASWSDYRKAAEYSEKLCEMSSTTERKLERAAIYCRLGEICEAGEEFAKAREYYEKSYYYSRELCDSGMVEDRVELASIYDNLGKVCIQLDKPEEVAVCCEKAYELRKKLYEESNSLKNCRDLASACISMGDQCEEERGIAESYSYYKQGLELNKKAYELGDTIEDLHHLVINYAKLGDVCVTEGKLSEADFFYRNGYEAGYEVCKDVDTTVIWQDMSYVCGALGEIHEEQGDLEAAYSYYAKGLKFHEKVYTGTPEEKAVKIIFYESMGTILEKQEKFADACELYATAGKIWSSFYVKELELWRKRYEETNTVEDCVELIHRYNKLIKLGREGDAILKRTDAEFYYQQSLLLRKKLYEEENIMELYDNVYHFFHGLGDVCVTEGNLSEAYHYYEKELKLREKLYEANPTEESRRDLLTSYECMEKVCEKTGMLSDVQMYRKQIEKLRE